MRDHLDDTDATRFSRREMTGQELLEADAHLRDCVDCRARLAALVGWMGGVGTGGRFGATVFGQEHLTYDQLADYTNNRLTPHGRSLVEQHIAQCPRCRTELEELTQFAEDLAAQHQDRPSASPSTGPTDLDSVYERCRSDLQNWARGVRLPNASINTDDIINEVLETARLRLASFEIRSAGAFEAYVRQAVRNEIVDSLRRAARSGKEPIIGTLDQFARPSAQDDLSDPLRGLPEVPGKDGPITGPDREVTNDTGSAPPKNRD